jgi:hypothetical protein
VIDIGRHAIDFCGEGNRDARRVDKVAMAEWKVAMPGALAVSVWQAAR